LKLKNILSVVSKVMQGDNIFLKNKKNNFLKYFFWPVDNFFAIAK